MFRAYIYEKYQGFLTENFQFLEVKFSIYLNRRVFTITYTADMLYSVFTGRLFILQRFCIA